MTEKHALDQNPIGQIVNDFVKSFDFDKFEWQEISIDNRFDYSKSVGLYHFKDGDKSVYIGKATEYKNGGLQKRLSDYCRESDSARKSEAGKEIHERIGDLTLKILIVGENENAAILTTLLEQLYIRIYNPSLNIRKN
jgi:excinuclease UvrABC nuclease subunit